MAIPKGYEKNFNTMLKAADAGHLALLDCQDAKTGEQVIAIVAINHHTDGTYSFTPFAKMFNGNPYKELVPPNPDQKDPFPLRQSQPKKRKGV